MIEQAVERFDAMNARDPNPLVVDGVSRPRELVQAERLEAWVKKLAPDASVALRLAARCQHLCRWEIPRSSYGEGRVAYLKWRKDLARHHADLAATVLAEVGFDQATLEDVRRINLKQGLKSEPDTQTMEDALCLAFLEHEFAEFAPKYDDAKVIDIVQKTWRKMSERGHELALGLPFSPETLALVSRALSEAPAGPPDGDDS
jgi:hypothetical protein